MQQARRMAWWCALASAAFGGGAQALSFDLLGAEVVLDNQFVLGASWRMEERNDRLVGKLNVNPDLCPDDCFSFSGDPQPNQQLVDAPGAFLGANMDNGNLNYDQYDLVAAQARLRSELEVFFGDTTVKVSGLGFYDFENTDFQEFHPDTAFQPRYTRRPRHLESQVGHNVDLLEAHITQPFELFGHRFQLRVGEQRVRWGESTFVAQNSLDQLNPPDENRLHFPGSEIASVFEPTGLAVLSTNLTSNLLLELVYQYRWEPVTPSAAGSFFSTNDIAGGGDNLVVSLGQFSEDPDQVGGFKNSNAQLITSTANNVPVDYRSHEPRDSGQYGGKLEWYAPNINGGTEFGFYYLNYHSRLPYLSVTGANRSCLRDRLDLPDGDDLPGFLQPIVDAIEAGFPGERLSGDGLTGLIACQGFNGTLSGGTGREPLPLDTLGAFLEYPEDIDMYGLSFNTNVGRWSLAGEFSYRPNVPVQVAFSDVIFAGLQPALPDEDINLIIGTVPSARHAIPDYVATRYRGHQVQPGDHIAGYERTKLGQLDFTGIRVFGSSNPLAADQIIFLAEVGGTYMFDYPDVDELQFEGGGPNCTHRSPGADGTGRPGGVPDPRSFNPTQGEGCYADEFSWGYRLMATFQYNNLLFGLDYMPLLAFFHDVDGVAPFPMQNFVEGRKEYVVGTDVLFSPQIKGGVQYHGYFGSGERRNSLKDRDNISVYLRYDF